MSIVLVVLGAALCPGLADASPILYITNGDAAQLQAIDTITGNVLYTATTHQIGYPLAVRSTIWVGQRDDVGQAREYNLANGAFAGGTAALPGPNVGNFVDGAVNGGVNYTLNAFGNTATVYSTNLNWTNPVAMFNVSGNDVVGITYDDNAGTLWISDTNRIYNYTLAGALLSSFAHVGSRGSLAFQSDDDTLWYVPNNPSASLLHYSTVGALLGIRATPTRSDNVWGAEFQNTPAAAVPEPTSLLLLGSGIVAMVARKRMKRNAGVRARD